MKLSPLAFREIEHKFLVDEAFDPAGFAARVEALKPTGRSQVDVKDTYYLVDGKRGLIYRHRIDEELQQLTVKSLQDDPENRLEVNLDLGLEHGDQTHRVRAFLSTLGITWSGALNKKVEAFYFDGCEIVFYIAEFNGRVVRCVEFEAVDAQDLSDALEVLNFFEQRLGFQTQMRCSQSLFELLIVPSLPADIQKQFPL